MILDRNKEVSEQLSEVCKYIENGILYAIEEMFLNGAICKSRKEGSGTV